MSDYTTIFAQFCLHTQWQQKYYYLNISISRLQLHSISDQINYFSFHTLFWAISGNKLDHYSTETYSLENQTENPKFFCKAEPKNKPKAYFVNCTHILLRFPTLRNSLSSGINSVILSHVHLLHLFKLYFHFQLWSVQWRIQGYGNTPSGSTGPTKILAFSIQQIIFVWKIQSMANLPLPWELKKLKKGFQLRQQGLCPVTLLKEPPPDLHFRLMLTMEPSTRWQMPSTPLVVTSMTVISSTKKLQT